jgi:hypothetical protein
VPVGNSIWMSVVRTIVRSIYMLSGQSSRQVLASTVHEGIEHVRRCAGADTPSRAELTSAVADLCVALSIAPPK